MSSPPTSNNHENLTALYHETWGEIHRLRDLEWKIAYSFVTLSAGLIALLTTDVVRALLSARIRWILTVLPTMSLVFALAHLNKTHNYLTEQRNIRRKIEDLFGFSESGIFGTEPVLPEAWKGNVITHRFQRTGLLIPLMLMIVVIFGFTVFMIWSL